MGGTTLGYFFALQGTGDLGDTFTLPDGQSCERLPQRHTRRYVFIFGAFTLTRTVYGSRDGQSVEQAFGQTQSTKARILNLNQSVDSLEHRNVQMAEQVTDFRENRPQLDPATEGPIPVTSGDGKGIVMRRSEDDPAPPAHRTKGQKASQKRMAALGTASTVERCVRTPEEVVATLFRDGPKPPPRPQPTHKRVWARSGGRGGFSP